MTNIAKLSRSRQHSPQTVLRVHPVAAACSLLLLAMGAAQAQTAAEGSTETVVVTGIRKGIESSIAVKRNSDSIVEAVSAEDIGKLPDVSIAESLARLPGLTAQRVDGRASVISIRGLSPSYGTTLLNGREMVSTGDSRSVEYDQFPSELLSGATVYKTPDGALIGQGLSGTVDMQTVRPLNFNGRQVVFNARGEVNSNGKLIAGTTATGNRLSASYIDQFADKTIGIALGLAHLDSPGQEKAYKSWWWSSLKSAGTSTPVGLADSDISLNGAEAFARSSENKRDGFMAVLEYRPNKEFHSTLDLYYSKFDQKRQAVGILVDTMQAWDGAARLPTYSNTTSTIIDGHNVITSGTVSNIPVQIRNDYSSRQDTVAAFGWNNELKLADWTAIGDLSYSKTNRTDFDLQTYAGQNYDGFFNFSVPTTAGIGRFTPSLNYADATTTLIGHPRSFAWGVHDGLLIKPKVSDELGSLRLSAKRDLDGIFSRLNVGLNYADRTKNINRPQQLLELKNDRAKVPVPDSMLRESTGLPWVGIPGVLTYDAVAASSVMYDVNPGYGWDEQSNHYSINEKATTLFSKLDIDTEIGGIPVRGNIGMQAVHTSQSSNGFAWIDRVVPITAGKSYNDYLPSLNLAFNVAPNSYLRFGLARVMARPFMDDMRAGFDQPKVNVDAKDPAKYGHWFAAGGNPNLEPWRANSIDISFEKYFGKRSYVSAAAFHKDLKTFIYKAKVPFDFSAIPNDSGVTPVSNIGELTAPANGHGGNVEGVELAASLEGALLHPSLDGFGVIGSVSNTNSSLMGVDKNSDLVPGASLDGLSGTVATLTAYYEKSGFSARIAERYRSAYETRTRGVQLLGALEVFKVNAERQLDLQLGYSFETGSLKGLSVLFQVNNLNNSPYTTNKSMENVGTPSPLMPEQYNTYGRQMLFGVTYKL